MDITVLGDVIRILKHAKEVQKRRTSESVLDGKSSPTTPSSTSSPNRPSRIVQKATSTSTSSPTPNRIVVKPSLPQPIPSIPETSTRKPEVTSRLGPPTSTKFNKSQSFTVDKSGHRKPAIFDRLDNGNKKKITPISHVREEEYPPKTAVKRPAPSSSSYEIEPKKRYFQVKTLADGTKIKEPISPSDHRVQRNLDRRINDGLSYKDMLIKKRISPHRDRAKVFDRIGGREGSSGDSRYFSNTTRNSDYYGSPRHTKSLVADRSNEQQKSVRSRLSLPSSSSSSSRFSSSTTLSMSK